MKTRLSIATALLFISSMFVAKAQTVDSKYGVDSVKTLTEYSLFKEPVKQKNYKDALPHWRYIFFNAPAYQKGTYLYGIKIMRHMFKKTRDVKYIDTLMMIYDKRMKYFGKSRKYPKSWILGRKAGDLFTYRKKDIDAVKQAYQMLQKSIEMRGVKSEAKVIDNTMEASSILVKAGAIEAEEVIDNYLLFMDMAKKQKDATTDEKKKDNIENARRNVERIFFTAGVADCETLSKIFTPKFEANKDDLKLVNKILRMLNRQECDDSELYAKAAERKYQLEPGADAAYSLARMFLSKGDFGKAKKYFTEAIGQEKDADRLADLEYKFATILLIEKNYPMVKQHALKALQHRPRWGAPQILIGKAYAAYHKKYSTKKLEQSQVFWAAVDRFNKAKADPDFKEEAIKLIKTYSKYFPRKEEAFFEHIKQGDRIKLKGWINETTRARLND